jgi:predicted dehydrogenase
VKPGQVYVATPHPQHFANVKDALEAGKHVLCEKARPPCILERGRARTSVTAKQKADAGSVWQPFVLTAAQATELVELARAKNLFLMEGSSPSHRAQAAGRALWLTCSLADKLPACVPAGWAAVWTRFQPIVAPAQAVVFDGTLGQIKRCDSRFDKQFGDLPKEHRMLNPELAGGALFDLGPYAALWPTLFLFQHPANERHRQEAIQVRVFR